MSESSFFYPTVNEILSDFNSKFRILVLGKPESGKTELINQVFGVDASPENGDVVEKLPGAAAASIQGGFSFPENDRFVLYTSSRDYLPNSDTDFDNIREFLRLHLSSEDLRERIHAVWVCVETPFGGERLSESGIERILGVANKKVPIVIVLTKFDELVNSIKGTKTLSDLDREDAADDNREEAERLLDDTMKKVSLDSLLSQQLVTPVSTMAGYEDTVSALIQSTDGAIQKLEGIRTHDSPTTLAWAIAQRRDLNTTVAATIDIGRKRHWSGLGGNTDFAGRTLGQCTSIIHEDIIAIWNLQDSSGYLGKEDFKARISHLVEDLALASEDDMPIPCSPSPSATFAAATATPIVAIGAVAEAAKWVSNMYQTTPNSIACIMGYIVDLVTVLTFLAEIHQFPETTDFWRPIEEDAVNSIKGYTSSKLLHTAHEEIRIFATVDRIRGITRQNDIENDIVQKEIVRLVKKFHQRARDVVKKISLKESSPAISVTSVSDKSAEHPVKGEPVLLQRSPSARLRMMPRRGLQELAVPDILTIVEEATRTPVSISRTPSAGAPHPTLLASEVSHRVGSAHPSANALMNWIRGDHPTPDLESGNT